ncbi:hypothetical protein AK812_SmicGene38099 [Symbiodinium microadriaticum]|uniref:Uncharacterized protein n=1 Tax=Symbiodinium microadriaticum TaxID=2951 RepID=A0A1Q9CEN1_SYMMI|nr:hypothetical protein AK812_SmicGene38099 [Symbiodinium microadriaticum]
MSVRALPAILAAARKKVLVEVGEGIIASRRPVVSQNRVQLRSCRPCRRCANWDCDDFIWCFGVSDVIKIVPAVVGSSVSQVQLVAVVPVCTGAKAKAKRAEVSARPAAAPATVNPLVF